MAAAGDTLTLGFPFAVGGDGRIAVARDGERLRGRVLQVLLTTPGERVNLPEFGCGLADLVFAPNDPLLAATTEFTVAQALARWLSDELIVEAVDVEAIEETVTVEVAWVTRADRSRDALRVRFG
jgi:phage baseplate assembly protein W